MGAAPVALWVAGVGEMMATSRRAIKFEITADGSSGDAKDNLQQFTPSVGPSLADVNWLRGFRERVSEFLEIAYEIVRCHQLPKFPISNVVVELWYAFHDLDCHLKEVSDYCKTVKHSFTVGPVPGHAWWAFRWAHLLVLYSALKQPLLSILEDKLLSWLPSEAELDAYRTIGEYLSRLDLERDQLHFDELSHNKHMPGSRRRLSISGNEVNLDGVLYFVEDNAASFLYTLIQSGAGNWVSGREMGDLVQPRPDRVFGKIKTQLPSIAALIDSETGKGYRLRSDVATPPNARDRP